jgi:DNA-binding NarL/FixJ family response regulator
MPSKRTETPLAKVLIVDDHPAVREALSIRISQSPDMEVCGEAGDVANALKLVAEREPDLAIVDITLKGGDGIDLIKRFKAQYGNMRILVWSMHNETLYAERALRAGAQGYITKEEATVQIVEAIRQVLDGQVYLCPGVAEKLLHRAVRGQSLDRSPVEELSDRELEVLRMIGNGIKTSEVARQLHLSIKTIETYRDRIRQKLNLSDGTDLIRYAAQWVMEQG